MGIHIQPRQTATSEVERSHNQHLQPHNLTNKSSDKRPAKITPFIMLGALTLTGCYRPATNHLNKEADDSTIVTRASGHPTLPSMTTYTLEQTQGKQAGGPPPSSQDNRVHLLPGEYCFHKESTDNWLSIRLALSDNQQIDGESAGTITHPEQGTTYYKQSFKGTLTKNQALVNVTTNIDGLTQNRQEAWAVDTTALDMGRVSIAKTPCLDIASNFQS